MDFLKANSDCSKMVGDVAPNGCQISNNKSSEIEVVCREQKELVERLYAMIGDLRQRLSPVLISIPTAGCDAEKRSFSSPLAVFTDGNNEKLRESIGVINGMLETLQM